MAAAPVEVVTGLIDALNAQDWDGVHRWMAADVVDRNRIIHGEADEPGAAFEGFRLQFEAFPDLHARPDQLIAEGDDVVVRFTVTGTHAGAHIRMPDPTGRRFEVEQIWIFRVRDGRVQEIRAVSDRLGMFLQLGWPWPELD